MVNWGVNRTFCRVNQLQSTEQVSSIPPTLIYPCAHPATHHHVLKNYIPTHIIGRLLPIPGTIFFFPHTTIRNPRFAFFSLASNDQQELLDSSFRLLSNVTTAKGGAPQARNCVRLEAAVLHVEEVSNVVQRGVQCVKTKIICCCLFFRLLCLCGCSISSCENTFLVRTPKLLLSPLLPFSIL